MASNREGCCRAAVDSEGFAHDHAEWYEELQRLRKAVDHLLACYTHDNQMATIAAVGRLREVVDGT